MMMRFYYQPLTLSPLVGTVCQGNVCCIQLQTMLCKVSQEEGSICKFLSCDCDCIACTELAKVIDLMRCFIIPELNHVGCAVKGPDLLLGWPHFVSPIGRRALPLHSLLLHGKEVDYTFRHPSLRRGLHCFYREYIDMLQI